MFFVHLIVSIVSAILAVLETLMLVRAIFSWLPLDEDSPIQRFLYLTTEPIILPVRILLEKVNFLSGFPIDLSFLVTYILLSIVSMLLPAVHF
jgi:uncharacterized protein YggT (Ycf19 family)